MEYPERQGDEFPVPLYPAPGPQSTSQDGAPLVSPWKWTDLALMAAVIAVLFLGGALLIRSLFGVDDLADLQSGTAALGLSVALATLEGVAILGSVWLVGLRRRGLGWSAVGMRPPTAFWAGLAFVLGLGVIPFAGLISLLIRTALGQADENPLIPFLAPAGFSWLAFLAMLFLGGLVAPIAEEILFRGVLYTWLRSHWGVWAAIFASSLVFGVVHGEPALAAAAFLMGLLMAWVFEKSRSLWPAIIIHATINSINIILLYTLLARGILQGV